MYNFRTVTLSALFAGFLTTGLFAAAGAKPDQFSECDETLILHIIEMSLEPVNSNQDLGFPNKQTIKLDDMKIIFFIDSKRFEKMKGLYGQLKFVEFIVEAIKIVSSFKCFDKRFNEMLTKEKIVTIVASHFAKHGLLVAPEVISYFVEPQNMANADIFLADHQDEIVFINTQAGTRPCKHFSHPTKKQSCLAGLLDGLLNCALCCSALSSL